MSKNLEERIAIIGAGASGLTAALALKKRGFKNVVVFESEKNVGGKSYSVEYKGTHFDLGSMMFSRQDDTARLADHYQVPYQSFDTKDFYFSNQRYLNPIAFARQWYSLADIFWSLYGLHDAVRVHGLEKPGYGELDSDLLQPFQSYLQAHRLEAAGKAFQPAVTGLGYGYYESMPAVYCLKIISSMMNTSLLKSLLMNGGQVCFFPGGWQSLWERVAQDLDVRTGVSIDSIERFPRSVHVTVNGSMEVFDTLLVTTPLNHADTFLDVSDQERRLFNKIRSHRMITTLVEGSIPLKTAFFADHVIPERLGHVIGANCFFPETNCSVLFQTVPETMSQDEINRMIVEDLRDMGCEVKKIIAQKDWEYFYFVSAEDLRAGFYASMQALQGKRNTYYVSSILNFETVAHAQQIAEFVVDTYFS